MIDTIKQLITRQMAASLDTLKYCVDACPENAWQDYHNDAPFSQVVFHTLFFTDFYLGRDSEPFREQAFHAQHKEDFGDYEELEDRIPANMYGKPFCLEYLAHCYAKLRARVANETVESMTGGSGIDFRTMSRAELYVYNIRHIQHHAAQLGLRLQFISGKQMPWFSGLKNS